MTKVERMLAHEQNEGMKSLSAMSAFAESPMRESAFSGTTIQASLAAKKDPTVRARGESKLFAAAADDDDGDDDGTNNDCVARSKSKAYCRHCNRLMQLELDSGRK